MAATFVFLSMGWTLRVAMLPNVIGTWLGLAEQFAIAIGAVAIYAQERPAGGRVAVLCRVGFGLCQLVFALAHVLALQETIGMTPAYLPLGPRFWALATGAGHLVGGIMLLAGARPLLATRGLAAMFAAFGLLVWLPRLLNSGGPEAWAGNLINLALIGAVLAVGEAAARRAE